MSVQRFRNGFMVLVIISLLCFNLLMNQTPKLRNVSPSEIRKIVDPNLNVTGVTVYPCHCRRLLYRNPHNYSNSNSSNIGISTCSSSAAARGPGQRVVSYALYGKFLGGYYEGLLKLLPRVKEAYPGWLVRLYMDLSINETREWACTVACKNEHLDLCDIKNLPGIGDISTCGGTVWRFMVVGDPLVERYMIRDTDSPIIQREVDAVNDWLRSGRCFHGMRDHPFHFVPMMGGMWGGCNTLQLKTFQDIRKQLVLYGKAAKRDQQLLEKYMWPEVRKNVLMHDSYLCQIFPDTVPFPTERVNFSFVGMSSYLYGEPNSGKPCPVECRPPEHKDWEFC